MGKRRVVERDYDKTTTCECDQKLMRLGINNGRTLCKDCSYQVTHIERLWAKSLQELGVAL